MTIEELLARRETLAAQLRGITETAVNENRGLTDEETTQRAAVRSQIETLDEHIGEVRAQESREVAAAEVRVETGTTTTRAQVTEPDIYRRDDPASPSYFRDLFDATARGDRPAADRLIRSSQAQAETRALSTAAGAGGEFAPPLWLVEEFVALARAGRVTADLMSHDTLPGGVSSINLPKVATGTSTAVQATQNTALSETDASTSSVSSGIATIGGKQIVSVQEIRQSGIAFDRVILADLAASYAVTLDAQVISGTNASGQLRGLLNAGYTTVTYTNATPAVAGAGQFYSQLANAINTVNSGRFLPATAIVMHPRRWAWLLAAFDTTNRPLVVPNGAAFNQVATGNGLNVQGPAGDILGLPVYTDPNIPTNLGAGTNEDRVLVLRASDMWLYETAMETASFEATYADQASVLFRVLGFAAFIPHRYVTAGAVIAGTGLVTPTF